MDLGAIDLYRDRERGVAPYNAFRAEIGLERFRSFDDLTTNKEVVAKLRKAYGVHVDGTDRIEDLDLLVGTLCEGGSPGDSIRPPGFGFGETMFQVRQCRLEPRSSVHPTTSPVSRSTDIYSQRLVAASRGPLLHGRLP